MAIKQVKRGALISRVEKTKTLVDQQKRIFRIADKSVRDILNNQFSTQTKLASLRTRQAARVKAVNDKYVESTQGVLNKKTLDFLVQHSNIDVPTVTSIFAGFELAKASRADKSEEARKREVEGLLGEVAAAEAKLKDTTALSDAQIKIIQDGLNRNTRLLETVQKSTDADVTDKNRATGDEFAARSSNASTEFTQGQNNKRNEANNKTSEANAKLRAETAKDGQEQANARNVATNATSERNAKLRAEESNSGLTAAEFFGKNSRVTTPSANTSGSFFDRPVNSEAGTVTIPTLTVPKSNKPVPLDAPLNSSGNEFDSNQDDDFIDDPSTQVTGGVEVTQQGTIVPDAIIGEVAEEVTPIDDIVVGESVVANGIETSPVLGNIFANREELDNAILQDNTNAETVDINEGIANNELVYYENTETGQPLLLPSGDTPPNGFISVTQEIV